MSNVNYKDTISKRASNQGIPQQNVFASINNLSQEDLRLLAESAEGPFMVYLWSPIGTEAKLNAARNIGLHLKRESLKCPHCGKEVEDQAVTCVTCGTSIRGILSAVKTKDKTVAVILAIILGFWTWCYTYKKDAWKFWLNLGLSVASIGYWLPVAWIWAIVDAARRPKEFYTNFNQLVLGQASSIPTQAMPPLISQQRSVENEGQVSTNIAGAASGARNVVTPAATQEIVLATIVRVSDVLWGGFLSLHLTNRRIIVESVVGTEATVAATLAGGIVGTLIADNIATKKAQKLISEDRSIDQILGSTTKNYTLNYDDISDIVLKRKALPIGCSRCKIQSKQKNVTFAFKRAMFDDVSAMFGRILPGKTTFK